MSDQATIAALSEALDDEYRARATYRKVIERFGPVRPFVKIVEAEGRHIAALLRQFERFGAHAPADTWQDRVTAPDSLAEASAAGVEAEIENEALYARLLDRVSDAGTRAVLQRLQAASRERHLPAFQRSLARQSGGPGRGARAQPRNRNRSEAH
jgi:rubrerythrin